VWEGEGQGEGEARHSAAIRARRRKGMKAREGGRETGCWPTRPQKKKEVVHQRGRRGKKGKGAAWNEQMCELLGDARGKKKGRSSLEEQKKRRIRVRKGAKKKERLRPCKTTASKKRKLGGQPGPGGGRTN